MKAFIFILFFSLPSLPIFSQILNPIIEERVELMSIVFRLSEAEEYSQTNIPKYAKVIDSCFNSFKGDELITLTKEIRKKNEVAYDAVMSMALLIEIDSGNIILKNDVLIGSLDNRWGNYTEAFLILLNKFYKKTNFHKFYNDNALLYANTKKRFSEVANKIDTAWFEHFYGEQTKGRFNIILSLANGGGNYGPRIDYANGQHNFYCILGIEDTDSIGFPVFNVDYSIKIIIHEFNHSFCNQLIENNYMQMEPNSTIFYKKIKNSMISKAYGDPKIMQTEILVRAATIMYFKEHKATEKELNKMTGSEIRYGFFWIKPLLQSLEHYDSSRATYPTLSSYMPQIILLQNSLNPNELLKKFDCTGETEIIDFSIRNNSENVDPNITKLILKFSTPMNGTFGISPGKGGEKYFPNNISYNWVDNDKTEIEITFDLMPDKKYSLKFPSSFIFDENNCMLKQTYFLNFKTKK